MPEYKGVMVYSEIVDGRLSTQSTELLGCGRKLADDLGEELSAVLLGDNASSLAQETIAFGADKVYVVADPLLRDYQTDTYVSMMERVVKQVMPLIILFGQTAIGRDLAPRLAFRLGTTATTDCVALAIDPESKRLWQTKPIYGGKVQAVFSSESDPQIATVRAKTMLPSAPNTARKGEIITVEANLDPSSIKTRVLEKVKEEEKGIKLEEAPVIISGGRGIGGAEGFNQLGELAKLLKGAVGASRAACDRGWMPSTAQIGLTGKMVTPELYLAVGISGSSQHLAGCSGAKVIIAINKDPEASIFKKARYGVIGEWEKVIPAFTQKVKELLTE